MEFAKCVKKALIDKEQGFEWLAREVNIKTGLYCDSAYISKILSGHRDAPKIRDAIREILDIEDGDA